ncbi:MAG: S8 family serine peptidase [Acidimicrobiia bacterium]|nr:S8 family serine peptidase [Acidimicrobiia bacterium]
MRRTALLLFSVIALLAAGVIPAAAQESPSIDRELPGWVSDLRLPSPVTRSGVSAPAAATAKIESSLLVTTGTQQVMVRLTESAPAAAAGAGANAAGQRSALADVRAQQASVIDRAGRLNARVIGQTQRAANIVVLELDAADLADLAADPAIASVRPVTDYQLDLSETVSDIGAAAVQNLGYDGAGVSVAVLDSGIDYTHASFGGAGTRAAYEAAYGTDPADARTTTRDGLFPTAKVVDGFDFVGEDWPNGDLIPDPDPIDYQGHGTSVAAIIGGVNGVAPGVDLYAYKVCSAISTSCSGVALIQAMDAVVDPDGDGDTSDHVDVLNMSLGSIYGQPDEDDLSHAVDNATMVGVLTVASAGNSADKPYVTGSPAAAPSALSVAQTQVPSAVLPLLSVRGLDDIPAVFQPWSVYPTEVIRANVVFGDGAGTNLDGCAPFDADLTGSIVLVNRGSCTFTLKTLNVQNAGGAVAIVGLVGSSDPFPAGDGGDGPITIPSYIISLVNANLIRDGVTMTIDPAKALPLNMQMVGSSARGPSMSFNTIKPELGAPGALISAEAGSGTGNTTFGGTSGAAPAVSGSAALLIQAHPDRTPGEVKAVFMNTGETDILTEPAEIGGILAPITRIGGGEIRVDQALASPTAAWDTESLSGALSFGFHDVYRSNVRSARSVTVRNYGDAPVVYNVVPTFRYQDDADNGAVRLSAPARVRVPANGSQTFNVTMTINGPALREWGLDSGVRGDSGDTLSVYEYDGYVLLQNESKAGGDLHLAWHVLPRKADFVRGRRTVNVAPVARTGLAAGAGPLLNSGVATARIDAFSLIGRSPDLPAGEAGDQAPVIDLRYVGVATFPVPAGFCSANESFVMQLAINTWERQTHANAPALFEFDLDTNQDQEADYIVFNEDLAGETLSDGRNATFVLDVATGSASVFFLTRHNTNSANTVLTLCGEQIGMNASNFFDPITADVLALDNYFQGVVTDFISDIQFSPLGERYQAVVDDIAPGATGRVRVTDFGRAGTNPSETGLLLFMTGEQDGRISGAPEGREAMTIRIRAAKSPHGTKYAQ